MSTWMGVDVGATAVKVAVVRTAYRKVQLTGLAVVELAQVGSVDEAVALASRAALGEGGVADGIATSVDGTKATVRIVGLPGSAAKQVGDVLPFELEASVPLEMEDAVFDYRIMQGLRETKGEELGVLTAISRIEDVRARIELVKAATGHEPERVGVGAFPIANMLQYAPQLTDPGTVVIADLGHISSDILFLKAGEPVFARTIGYGTKGLPMTASKLARELRTTIASHRALRGDPPTRLVLTGGGAYVVSAEQFLGAALGIPVQAMQAPQGLEVLGVAPEVLGNVARFAKAIGLALGHAQKPLGFNLRRGPLAYERGFAWVKEKVPVLAGLGAVILVSFLFSAWAQLHAAGKEREVLEKALSNVTREVLGEETQSSLRANELLAKKTAINDDDPLPHADAFDVMVKLSEVIPPSMTHDIEELDVQKDHVIVHGIVGSIPDAQSIKTSLASERCFKDTKITRTTQVVGGDRQKYVLEFELKCPEDVKGAAKKKESSGGAAASSSAGGK